jgi:hypothetical protein
MKSKFVFSIFLIAVGIIALLYQGIYWTARERAAEPGSTGAAAEKSYTPPPSLIIGGIALGCGSLLLLSARKDAAAAPPNLQPL